MQFRLRPESAVHTALRDIVKTGLLEVREFIQQHTSAGSPE